MIIMQVSGWKYWSEAGKYLLIGGEWSDPK